MPKLSTPATRRADALADARAAKDAASQLLARFRSNDADDMSAEKLRELALELERAGCRIRRNCEKGFA